MTNHRLGASWGQIAIAALTLGLSACGNAVTESSTGDQGGGGTGATGTGATGTGASSTETGPSECGGLQLDGFIVRPCLFKTDDVNPSAVTGTVTGEVMEVGLGDGDGPCDHDNLHFVDYQMARARILDGDGVFWTVCVVASDSQNLGLTMPASVGQVVTVEAEYDQSDATLLNTGLNLRIGNTLVLYAAGTGAPGFPAVPPELSFSAGEELCQTEPSPCSDHLFPLVAESGGDTQTLLPGHQAVVGDYEVHFGGWDDLHDAGCEGVQNKDLFVLPKP